MADGDTIYPLDQLPQLMGGGGVPGQRRPSLGQPGQTYPLEQLPQLMAQRAQQQQVPSEEQAIGNLQAIVNQPKSWETTAGEIAAPTGTGMAGGWMGGQLGAVVGHPKAGARIGAGIGQTVGEELVQVIERHMRGQEAFPGEAERFLKRAGINIALNTFIEHYFPKLKDAIKYQLGGKSAEQALEEVYQVGEQGVSKAGQAIESAEQSTAARLAKMTEQEATQASPGARLEQIASETGRTPETAAATQMAAKPGELTPVGEHLQYQAPANFGIDFSSPQAPQQVAQWAQSASPEDKLAMKEMLGDHFASAPNRLATNDPTQANMWAQAWRSIDPKSKFANPDNILYVNGKLNALMSSPENYQRFLEGAGKKAMPIFDEGARRELAASRKVLEDLGPLGRQTLREIDAAAKEGPQAQALIARKYLQNLDRPAMAKQIGEQSTRFGRSVPEQVMKAAGRAEPSQTYLPRGLSRAARPGAMPWLIASGAISVATGRAPYFLTGLLAYGGYQAGKRALTNSLIKEMTQRVAGQSLGTVTEEAAAAAVIKSIAGSYGDAAISNLSNEAYESLGSVVVQHMSADASKQAAETYGPAAVEKVKEKIGPMVKEIDRAVAKNIASPERRIDSGHVDNIQKINEEVGTGKTPDIQRDLNSGRLSTAEARKMVEKMDNHPGNMFRGMSLDEAINAYIKGTDDEKTMGLAAIAQKLNDEGRNMSPVQRRAFMAQLRQALPQGEEGQ